MGQPQTFAERVEAELAAVTGDVCGWTCEHHDQDVDGTVRPFACQRAAGHAGAEVSTDMHIHRETDGTVVQAAECCPATGGEQAPDAAVPAAR